MAKHEAEMVEGKPGAASAPSLAGGRANTHGIVASAGRCIRVRGAKEHNLKNLSVEIPRDKLVVITGLSGSGKSSLAFDTIFAEGQRKYMESLSAYARQFLDQLKKPDVEEVEGIPPTIAIEQRSASGNPRSTVATTTEIYDYLRLLFARCGTAYSWRPTKVKKDGTVAERSGKPITATPSTQIVDSIMTGSPILRIGREADSPDSENRATQSRIMILAPVIRAQKGFHREALEEFSKQGWSRARVNGTIVELREVLKDPGENPLKLGRYEKHDIEAVIDRLTITEDSRQRIAESIEAALRIADGTVIVSYEEGTEARGHGSTKGEGKIQPPGAGKSSADSENRGSPSGWRDVAYSTKFADPDDPSFAMEELSPRVFSFNSPQGACKVCSGLGTLLELDEALVVPNHDLSFKQGAIAAYNKNQAVRAWFTRSLRKICKVTGLGTAGYETAFKNLPEDVRRMAVWGTTKEDTAKYGGKLKIKGAIPELTEWMNTTQNPTVKEWLSQFMSNKPCPACNGDRLRIEALHVLVESTHAVAARDVCSESVIGRPGGGGGGSGQVAKWSSGQAKAGTGSTRSLDHSTTRPLSVHHLNIAEISRLNINDAVDFVAGLKLTKEQRQIAEPILKEINNRLRFLQGVGLEYLSLSRKTATLSGGEAQRIRLASQVGSGLVGACYVLDEPTIGLHQRDNDRLIATLRHLTDIGNTVLVVEHDEDMIRAADHVLDIGPGPGVHGGKVVAQGTVADIIATPDSLTGQYLGHTRRIEIPAKRRDLAVGEKKGRAITLKGCRHNNLKNIDAVFPLGGFICVTGVSGSGKSTLVNDILLTAMKRHLTGSREQPGLHDSIKVHKDVDRIIEVDQSPIGRTPRSNPATYTGIFDDIRNVFATTKEAKIRGYKPGRFSFNVSAKNGGGRCEACEGQGVKKIEMHFLPDVFVECEVCSGKRYNRETLEVLYRGKSIADVLAMTVEQGVAFFENHPKIVKFVRCLHEVGLDYIQLGQPSTQLSGGEAQRVKLATELGKGAGELGSQGHTLYILDEPTTGLHFEDIRKLISVLNRLADTGNTLVIIEHNLDVIKCADWLIDLGPEGGDGGGRIVATGTPEQVAANGKSHTGRYLKSVLK